MNVAFAAVTAAVAVAFSSVLLTGFEDVVTAVPSLVLDVETVRGLVVAIVVGEVVRSLKVEVGDWMAASVRDVLLVVVTTTLLRVVVFMMLDCGNLLANKLLSRTRKTYCLDRSLRDELGGGLGGYRSKLSDCG